MKKIVILALCLVMTMAVSAKNEKLEIAKDLSRDLVETQQCVQQTIHYDKGVDAVYVFFKCPGLWVGESEYHINCIGDLFASYANIENVYSWTPMVNAFSWSASYMVDIDIEDAYMVHFIYYENSNILYMSVTNVMPVTMVTKKHR